MAERIISGYKRLFEVRLLHHYWLDEGATVFDRIPNSPTPPDQFKRDKRLLTYDLRSFMAVTPTVATARALEGFRCVYKNTALGCIAAAPEGAVIPPQTTFDFVVTIQNSAFFNYTAMTLRPQKIYELYYQPENKLYRYKENVPVLSNLTGASRDFGSGKLLFLSKEIPLLATDELAEWLVRSPSQPPALLQMISDQPGAAPQQLDDQATNMPVFVHQGDAPDITPPAGLIGAPACGILLSNDIPDDVYALIRLVASGANDGDYDFVDANGHSKTPHPVYQVRFKNRSTVWRYFNQKTGAADSTAPALRPLTHFGNAGTKQKPSEGLVKAVKTGDKITSLVSEIYV
jgi:hypothetical protein